MIYYHILGDIMDLELYKKMDELFNLLDELVAIKNISRIKKNISDDLLSLIKEYRLNPSIENKRNLYKNECFLQYIKSETELNYLIMEINNKFKRKRGHCESN